MLPTLAQAMSVGDNGEIRTPIASRAAVPGTTRDQFKSQTNSVKPNSSSAASL